MIKEILACALACELSLNTDLVYLFIDNSISFDECCKKARLLKWWFLASSMKSYEYLR